MYGKVRLQLKTFQEPSLVSAAQLGEVRFLLQRLEVKTQIIIKDSKDVTKLTLDGQEPTRESGNNPTARRQM